MVSGVTASAAALPPEDGSTRPAAIASTTRTWRTADATREEVCDWRGIGREASEEERPPDGKTRTAAGEGRDRTPERALDGI
jgi:hypothetical protein